ncbi:hypothetical protein U9M48_020387 [Paspalum notatum var. saurae]|uniref:Uncharacterized protein n=1 Tax=Paspalum notatum var. saurae TaxID=547442 RepID=A0AAQ3TFZ4_PASNO
MVSVPGRPSLGEAEAPSSPWKQAAPLCAAVVFAVVAWCAVREAEWAWLRPRRLGRALREQGLRGTAYRPLAGDAPLADRLAREARAWPPLPPGCHAVVPRAMPLFHHAMPSSYIDFRSQKRALTTTPVYVTLKTSP